MMPRPGPFGVKGGNGSARELPCDYTRRPGAAVEEQSKDDVRRKEGMKEEKEEATLS